MADAWSFGLTCRYSGGRRSIHSQDRHVVAAVASLNVSFGPGLPTRTGAIRMGRGSNSIEWLTIVGNLASASGN